MLKFIIAKLDEVDEKVRDFYKPQGDKFVLQVEGAKSPEDVAKTTKALQDERTAHKATQDALKVAADKLAGYGEDNTPEKVKEMAEKLQTLEAAGQPDIVKNFEKLVNERVQTVKETAIKSATAALQKQVNDLQTAHGNLTKENDTLKTNDRTRVIDDAVRAAATGAKIMDGAVVDALMRARGVFEIGQDGKVITKDGMTPQDWIEARKADAGHWWPVARGAGAHGSDGNGNFQVNGKDNPWTREGWNLTRQSQLVKEDSAKAGKLAEQAGSKIGATAPTAPAK
jgi:hypothetical protein